MSDFAFNLLAAALNNDDRASIVWVVDENLAPAELRQVVAKPQLQAITNRIDICNNLQACGIPVQLSDFTFTDIPQYSCDAIYFRVSKEKAIVHHVVNLAARYLKVGGELVLAGCKNEGIKTYTDKAASYLGGSVDKQRGKKTAMLNSIAKGDEVGSPLDDKNYTESIELSNSGSDNQTTDLFSKPGLYGWNKIDKGSELLISVLPDILEELPGKPQSVVDIGCGYGYLSIKARQFLSARFVATDNNVAAVDMCKKNFSRYKVDGEVVLADCAQGINHHFDLVLCNPPFHQGFSVEGDLTQRFIGAAKRLLAKGGAAVFVVNSFIPLERKAQSFFSAVETIANNGSFKILLLKP